MRQPERPGEVFPYSSIPPIVVIRELCQVANRVRALYVSEDWEFVRGSMSRRSRAEAAGALRAVAYVAQSMAESLDEKGNVGEDEPPTNYGVQR